MLDLLLAAFSCYKDSSLLITVLRVLGLYTECNVVDVIVVIIIIVFMPSVSRIPRDLETEKLEIENVRSDT